MRLSRLTRRARALARARPYPHSPIPNELCIRFSSSRIIHSVDFSRSSKVEYHDDRHGAARRGASTRSFIACRFKLN